MAMSGEETAAVPESSVTGVVTSWPSLAKVMVPVGTGLVGGAVDVTVAAKV
jgi:hypothetical protein